MKIEDFRKITDQAAQQSMANEIYTNFLDPNSEKEVNVSSFLVKKVKADLDQSNVDKNMFDVLQREVFHLMDTDTYKRFIQSPLWTKTEKEFLSQESRLARQRSNSLKIRNRAGSSLPLPVGLEEK